MRSLMISVAFVGLLLTNGGSAMAHGMGGGGFGGGFGGMMAGGGGFRGGDMATRGDGFRGFDNRGFDRAGDFDRGHDRFRDRFHDRFHDRFFFHSFFFFGTEVFAPVPVALYPWLPYPAYVFAAAPGPSCYQYQTTLSIEDKLVPAWGTACLQADGTWRSVS